jgi:hypothetical protein
VNGYKYTDKIIRVLALFAGEKRAMKNSAIESVFQWNKPMMDKIKYFLNHSSDKDVQEFTEYLLDLVDSIGHLMNYFKLDYPADWEEIKET